MNNTNLIFLNYFFSCSIGAAKSSFELLYESAIVHEIDQSPTIKTDFGSIHPQSEHNTPINISNFSYDYSKNHSTSSSNAAQKSRDPSYSPFTRSIQKAPPPPENVFNTHKTVDTLRRQQRQQQRRERKKELKQQYKQTQQQQYAEVNPDFSNQNNFQYIPSNNQHFNMAEESSQINPIKVPPHQTADVQCSSYVPYDVVTTVPFPQQAPCPQCPPQYIVRGNTIQYIETQSNFVKDAKCESKKSYCQDNNNIIQNKRAQKGKQEDEQAPKIRSRSKSIHCHEYISPLFHEEIVTVVDDCHLNLLNKTEQRPKTNMIQRRSRSSSGVNNVVLKNWPDHRQNSYETVIAALDEENMIINNVDYFPQDERYPAASMPLHSRLSTSNEALTRPNSRHDGYDTNKSCSEGTDQYYLTRSLHRKHVSGHGSKKRGKGGTSGSKVSS